MFARLIFAAVNFAARNGLTELRHASTATTKAQARTTGICGETYAYWYLRRHGYTLVARNYTVPGIKGEIDLIGYDGRALAFVEVDKRRNLSRMARQFLRSRRIDSASCRFDVPGDRIPRREKANRSLAQIRIRHGVRVTPPIPLTPGHSAHTKMAHDLL